MPPKTTSSSTSHVPSTVTVNFTSTGCRRSSGTSCCLPAPPRTPAAPSAPAPSTQLGSRLRAAQHSERLPAQTVITEGKLVTASHVLALSDNVCWSLAPLLNAF
jgi:hypothetical protein